MKKVIKNYLLILLITINLKGYASENRILIKVDSEIITTYDVLLEMNYLGLINKSFEKFSKEQFIEIAKNSLIKEKIKKIELKKFISEIKLDDEDLNKYLLRYFNSYGINSIKKFNEYFISRNIKPEIIKNKVTLEILWNQLIYEKYNDKIKINRELIEEQVKKNNQQNQYLLYEILFDLSENENLNEKYDLIKKEIFDTDFSKTALKFSISDSAKSGGKLGWVKSSVLSKEIIGKLSDLKIGDFTSPITIPGGFLILKIEDLKLIENNLNFEEEVNFIIQKKSEQQLNQFSNIYLKKIRKNIQINEI